MSAAEFDVMAVVQELMGLSTFDEFAILLAQRPELLGDRMLAFLDESGQLEGFGPIFRSLGNLLRDARVDREAAWKTYEERRSQMEGLAAELEAGTKAVETRWTHTV